MKKHRFLYLTGVVGVVCGMMGVLFFSVFPNMLRLSGETAVSQTNPLPVQQVAMGDGWLTAVSEQLEAVEYAISSDGSPMQIAYQAPNRAQNLRTSFSEYGIQVEPRLVQGAAWQLGLELVGVDNGLQAIVPELVAHTTADNRVTMDYGQWQAWYVNDARGVEQGFTFEEPMFAQETGLLQINMAVTGNLTPQLVSDDEVRLVTAVGEQMLTYQQLVAYDAQGKELPAKMEVVDLAAGQSGIRLAVEVADAAYPIVVDPVLDAGLDWVAWIAQADTNFGWSVSTAGDVNGDGFDDVLVGAPWFDGSAPDSGAVFGYYGGPDGLPLTYQWLVTGDMPGMELGYAVNPAGDVNRDGFADVIIGTHLTPTGKAFVYTGTLAGLSSQPAWVGWGEQADDGFGTAVNTAGDVNGDGYDDIIIGAPYYDIPGINSPNIDGGRAYVFSGLHVKNGQADLTLAWQAENDIEYAASGFGFSVGTAGDVDQNGFADVIIGAPYYAPEGLTGYAGIFSGTLAGLPGGWGNSPIAASDADWYTLDWFFSDSEYGASVGFAGDVNGDGLDDVIVGAPNYAEISEPPTGAVFVFTGTNPIGNMNNSVDTFSPWYWLGSVAFSRFGHSVGTAGDIDLDGYDDVIVGAPQYDNDPVNPANANAVNGGGVFLLPGSPSGFVNGWELSSNVAEAKFGTSVGTAGDVNGDGYADVLIGAPVMPNPDSALGEAYSLYGSGQITKLQAFNSSPTNLGSVTKLWAEIDAGGSLDYAWDLGDGSAAAGSAVDHVYVNPGYFTAVITATSLTDQMTATTAVTISASSLVNPVTGGDFKFVNETTGFGTGVNIPPGAVSETFKLTYTPLTTITQPSPANSLGYYFDLDTELPDYQVFLPVVMNGAASGGGTAVANSIAGENVTNSYYFNVPITITIVYTDTGAINPEDLLLKYWNKDKQEWIDIVEECNALNDGFVYKYDYPPGEKFFTAQVCHLSRFSVAG